MAYIDGNKYPPNAAADIRRMAILAFSCVLLVLMLLYYPGSGWGVFPALMLGAVSCVSVLLAYLKMHPLSWVRVFRRKEYGQCVATHEKITNVLSSLDDSNFLLSNIMVELFHVENLVVSRRGIFLIAGVGGTGSLERTDGVLRFGGRSLEKTTSNLWRLCYLLNILVKKSFKTEVMPCPVLVFPDTARVPFNDFDGILVTAMGDLLPALENAGPSILPREVCDSVAYFLQSRYVAHESPEYPPGTAR